MIKLLLAATFMKQKLVFKLEFTKWLKGTLIAKKVKG